MNKNHVISIIISLFGFLMIIFYMLFKPYTIKSNIQKGISNYEKITKEEISINNEKPFEFDDHIEDLSSNDLLLNNKVNSDNVIGQLEIPDLGLNLPILKGLTNDNLKQGVVTMREDQTLGQGNFPIAGHYMKNKNLLFGNLMSIQNGSDVYLNDKNFIYHYRIYETKIALDSEIHLISDKLSEKKGNSVVSLMTCYKTSKSGKRFFAFGELISKYPYLK